MRQALWLAFAGLLLLVTGTLLLTSYVGTRQLARHQAAALMAVVQRETEIRIHALFDPIRHKVIEDYASIRLGRFSSRNHGVLKERLFPHLFALRNVDSLMIGDLTGSQFLVMRYTPAVVASPVLASVARSLPPPPRAPALQFFTRDFRPAEWGENSEWTLWDEAGQIALQSWNLPLTGYDGRLRPWHQAAMARFADLPLDQANHAAQDLVAWTDVYQLFTTQSPGISASVAGRDPEGRVLIVAYDLLLDEIARFCTAARPTPGGRVFVFTEDNRLLGPPAGDEPATDEARAAAAILQPIASSGYPEIVDAVARWEAEHHGAPGYFRTTTGGGPCWAGFATTEIGAGKMLRIGILLPESDLVPAAAAQQRTILAVGALSILLAAIAAAWMARRIAQPLATLAAEAQRIARLDLSPVPLASSPIRELASLSRTINGTRESLARRVAEREGVRLALAEREQQFRTITDNTPDILIRLDRESRHLFVNPAHAAATGLTPEQVLGRTVQEAGYPAAFVPRIRARLEEAFGSGAVRTLEFEYPTPTGPRHFEARLIRETRHTFKADSVLVVIHDISARVEAAAELARSNARHHTILEAALVGIVVYQDELIRYANTAALQLFGYTTPDEAVDKVRWDAFVDPASRDELATRAAAALQGEPPPPHAGWVALRADGNRRWVQSNVTAIEWDGRPAVLSFIRDITELRAANEREATLADQLRHSQKLEAVGLLAGGIAHDFNNMLQIIGGNAQLAEEPELPLSERGTAITEINKTVQRASQLTRQLLAFSRRQSLAREQTELNDFVAEHVQMLQRVLPANIRLVLRSSPGPIALLIDRGQIEQVLLNLCLNARDAMPGGGTLAVEVSSGELPAGHPLARRLAPGQRVARLLVRDTGHGMDQTTLARIFEPFFTTKPRDKGTGLGLAVVYGIVHQHEGHIEVHSRIGEGTTFTVLIPIQAERKTEDGPELPVGDAAPPPVKATILLAEDDRAIRRLAALNLERAGYKVLATEDGQRALNLFRETPEAVDLLFFDVMMPELGGFEAARRCQQFRPGIPVLFASGYAADSVDEDQSRPPGAIVLQKPYRTAELLQTIARILAARRSA